MKKATSKATTNVSKPPSLGTKRTCPECGTKFYDFNKESITCPKCEAKVDPNNMDKRPPKAEAKKPKKELPEEALIETEDVVVGGAEEFESVDDLDDDEDVAEEIDVDEDDKEDY